MSTLHVYLNSVEIKKQLVSRSQEFGIPFKYICKEIGIDYDRFLTQYINAKDSSKFRISEDDFERILFFLGMETRYTIVLKKDFNSQEILDSLRLKYESQ